MGNFWSRATARQGGRKAGEEEEIGSLEGKDRGG